MNKGTTLLRRLGLSFGALLIAVSFTLTGCSMDSLGGPDLSAAQEYVDAGKNGGGGVTKGDSHNEETANKNGGGGVTKGDSHNEETSR